MVSPSACRRDRPASCAVVTAARSILVMCCCRRLVCYMWAGRGLACSGGWGRRLEKRMEGSPHAGALFSVRTHPSLLLDASSHWRLKRNGERAARLPPHPLPYHRPRRKAPIQRVCSASSLEQQADHAAQRAARASTATRQQQPAVQAYNHAAAAPAPAGAACSSSHPVLCSRCARIDRPLRSVCVRVSGAGSWWLAARVPHAVCVRSSSSSMTSHQRHHQALVVVHASLMMCRPTEPSVVGAGGVPLVPRGRTTPLSAPNTPRPTHTHMMLPPNHTHTHTHHTSPAAVAAAAEKEGAAAADLSAAPQVKEEPAAQKTGTDAAAPER
jgi:hypothetical protein